MRRRSALAAAVLLLSTLVAACGGDDSADSTTSSVVEETTTTEDMETTTSEGTETTTTVADEGTTTTQAPAQTTTTGAEESEGLSLADVVSGDDRFTTLLAAVEAAGLTQRLDDPEAELTVFAPTNEAFEAALSALEMAPEELLAAPDLDIILAYHMVPEVYEAADIIGAGSESVIVDTVAGESLSITISDGGEVRFLEAGGGVVEADIQASNGIIHVIDVVLLPPSLGA